ncbi:MAG: 50S ribosomal protein L11 methyltransferase [Pseudomonadota bacterium]
MSPADPKSRRYIQRMTRLRAPRLVPEITLHLADAPAPLWTLDSDSLAAHPCSDPFWAFAWAGGLGAARWLLDQPDAVRGHRVLDLATGSGLCAIAAAKAGAGPVDASDIDAWAVVATRLNAALNGVALRVSPQNLLDTTPRWDTIVCGDLFYEAALATRVSAWFDQCAAAGTQIIVGDPGRTYLPVGLTSLAEYSLQTEGYYEDTEFASTRVWLWPPRD